MLKVLFDNIRKTTNSNNTLLYKLLAYISTFQNNYFFSKLLFILKISFLNNNNPKGKFGLYDWNIVVKPLTTMKVCGYMYYIVYWANNLFAAAIHYNKCEFIALCA